MPIISTDTTIRNETERDIDAIAALTLSAFKDMAFSQHTEQFIITALRDAKALAISLVAEVDKQVVGHIAFSPVTISDGTTDWYGLGPVSVHPSVQRRGIGSCLIREGLSRLELVRAKRCCVVGHPAYYPRFGFEPTTRLSVPGVPPEVFFIRTLTGTAPAGDVRFHEAFQAQG